MIEYVLLLTGSNRFSVEKSGLVGCKMCHCSATKSSATQARQDTFCFVHESFLRGVDIVFKGIKGTSNDCPSVKLVKLGIRVCAGC